MAINERDLVSHYQAICRDRMRGLPICNPALDVEAVGFRALDNHRLGVLITPWFMNLVLLPGDETWSSMPDGAIDTLSLPSESCEFTICRDTTLGTFLSAVLFRTVVDFPDRNVASAVAEDVLEQLFTKAEEPVRALDKPGISRRSLFTGMRAT